PDVAEGSRGCSCCDACARPRRQGAARIQPVEGIATASAAGAEGQMTTERKPKSRKLCRACGTVPCRCPGKRKGAHGKRQARRVPLLSRMKLKRDLKYKVSFDRPRGLSVEGGEDLVLQEGGPLTLRQAAALSRKWQVGASVREWGPDRFFVGRLDKQ